MDDQSQRLIKDIHGASPEELGWQSVPGMNTIGMLLAHMAIVEVFWTQAVLEERKFDSREVLGVDPDDDGMPLPPEGLSPAALSGKNLAFFVDLLERARDYLKGVARSLSTDDLSQLVSRTRKDGTQDTFNKSWALYHLLEHEAAHYGQIMLLRHLYRASVPLASAGQSP
jgi:uncharacterized damage-inducible protein DinB